MTPFAECANAWRREKPQKERQKADSEQYRCQKRRGTSSSRPQGVTSKKLAADLNVDRFFVDRIVREAAVMTYRRAIGPEFSPELEQRQKTACRKEMGQNIHFELHRRRGGPS